jgi:hypothetical protein
MIPMTPIEEITAERITLQMKHAHYNSETDTSSASLPAYLSLLCCDAVQTAAVSSKTRFM